MRKFYLCLKNELPEFILSEEVMEKARKLIDRMLATFYGRHKGMN